MGRSVHEHHVSLSKEQADELALLAVCDESGVDVETLRTALKRLEEICPPLAKRRARGEVKPAEMARLALDLPAVTNGMLGIKRLLPGANAAELCARQTSLFAKPGVDNAVAVVNALRAGLEGSGLDPSACDELIAAVPAVLVIDADDGGTIAGIVARAGALRDALPSANLAELCGKRPEFLVTKDRGEYRLTYESEPRVGHAAGMPVGEKRGDEKSAPGDRTLVAPAVIGFMLRLTFQAVGQPYRVDDLPLAQRAIAEDLAHLGLLYLFAGPGKEGYYVPTQLTAGLAGGGSENDPDNDDGDAPGGDSPRKAKDVADGDESLGGDAGGHIIAETNFRVYAYTFSDVECEILRLFTRPDYRLPNLYVGMLTREAVHEALDTGVAAEQIIKYIKSHAHPNARKTTNGSGIPPNVADQIMLWAMERRRVRSADCVLYCDFPTGTDEYAAAVKAASDAGVLLWEDREQMKLAVAKSGHERMKEVFKAMRMQGGSGMQGGGAALGGGLTVAMRRK